MRTLILITMLLMSPAPSRGGDDTKKLGKTLQEWMSLLDTKDAKARVQACQAIGDWQRDGAPTVAALVKVLKDESTDVKIAALGALGRIGPAAKDAVPPLKELVASQYNHLRVAALDALAGIGPRAKDAVPVVVVAAGDRETTVAVAALRALRHIGVASKEVITAITAASRDKDATVRRQAFLTWADIVPPQDADAPVVAAALADADADVRFAALHTWQQLYRGKPQGNKALIGLLMDADPGIRKQAVAMLLASCAKQVDPDVAKACTTLLSDPDGSLRVQAVLGLSYRLLPDKFQPTLQADPALLAVLIEIAKTGSPDARAAAATALGQFLPQQAPIVVPALLGLLGDKTPAVRREAAVRLLMAKMETDNAAKVLLGMLQDKHGHPEVRGEAARTLERLGDRVASAPAVLIEALGDPSAFVRQAAAGALSNVGIQAVKALQERLEDQDELVRVAAATALLTNSAKSTRVLDVLRVGLKGGDPIVRDAVLTGLAGLVLLPAELDPALEEVVFDPSPLTRRYAVLLLSAEYLRQE
jgi:HEAT repeat protein